METLKHLIRLILSAYTAHLDMLEKFVDEANEMDEPLRSILLDGIFGDNPRCGELF